MFKPTPRCLEYLFDELFEVGLYDFYFGNTEEKTLTLNEEQKAAIIKIVKHFNHQECNLNDAREFLQEFIEMVHREDKVISDLRELLNIPVSTTADTTPKITFNFQSPYYDRMNELALIQSALDKRGHVNEYGESKFYTYNLSRCYVHYFQNKAIFQE